MGIAALILGILSIIIGFIPLCGSIALLPAIIGLILGIIDTIQKNKKSEKKGVSIAGLVLSAIAIVVIVFWVFIFGVLITSEANQILEESTGNYQVTLNDLYDDYDAYDYEY